MSEEVLQNETVVEDNSTEQVEDQKTGAELATASEAEHEDKPQVDDAEAKAAKAQQATQEVINRKHRETKEAERKTAQLQSQLDEIKRKEQEQLAASVANIPDLPVFPTDSFDDDYDQQVANYNQAMADRDAKIEAKANFDAQQNFYTQQSQYQQQQLEQEAQAKAAKAQNDFVIEARSAGATDEEFNSVINILNNGGMTMQGADAIMSLGSDGYFIAKHLAANPIEAHEYNTMNPILAGAKLVELKQQASALKPKTTKTPKPSQDIKGAGAKPDLNKYPNSAGATFT